MVVIGLEERGVDRGERCGLVLLKSRKVNLLVTVVKKSVCDEYHSGSMLMNLK